MQIFSIANTMEKFILKNVNTYYQIVLPIIIHFGNKFFLNFTKICMKMMTMMKEFISKIMAEN